MAEEYLGWLETMVNIDSGTGDSEGMEQLAAVIRQIVKQWGGEIQTLPAVDGSQHYYFSRGIGRKILLVAHLDTVFPKGTVARRSFEVRGDRAYGPGVSDCKSGVVTILAALAALAQRGWPELQLGAFFNTDEEMGSPGSGELIRNLARNAEAVLVLEPAEGETLTVARKGIGRFKLRVFGKAAHSGSNFTDGASAVVELSHKILALHQACDPQARITFNAGVISGGSKSNIIPDYAEAQIDLRLKTAAQRETAVRQLETIAARQWVLGTHSQLEGGITRPPLEVTEENMALYQQFKQLGREMGLELEPLESGGGSDANLVATVGVPVLDGLGPIGGGHHTAEEYLELPSLRQRIELLTEFLLRI